MGKKPPPPSSAESAEPATSTGLGARVKDAIKRVTDSHEEAAPPPSPDEDVLEEGQKLPTARFPSRELKRAFAGLGAWALGLSLVIRVVIALALGIAIAMPIVIPILQSSPEVTKYYINRTEPLQQVPHPTAFEPLTELERNTEVEILRSEEGYALVRTVNARVGFVTKAAIHRNRVPMDPFVPFSNCEVEWNEKSPSLCELRATKQQEECSAVCAQEGNQNDCTTACATNLALCMESCSGVRHEEPESAVEAESPPETELEPAVAPIPVAPEERPEGVVRLVPTKSNEDKKREKKAKKRRRKRRRRPPSAATVPIPTE